MYITRLRYCDRCTHLCNKSTKFRRCVNYSRGRLTCFHIVKKRAILNYDYNTADAYFAFHIFRSLSNSRFNNLARYDDTDNVLTMRCRKIVTTDAREYICNRARTAREKSWESIFTLSQCNSPFIFHLRPSRTCPASSRVRSGDGCLSRKSDPKDRSNGERAGRVFCLYVFLLPPSPPFRILRIADLLIGASRSTNLS